MSLRPAALLAAMLTAFGSATVRAEGPVQSPAQRLQARHESLRDALADSPFRRPVLLQSSAQEDAPRGEVDAVVRHPFGPAAEALRQPASWCALLLLQSNIKRCEVLDEGGRSRLRLAVARRHADPVEDAQAVTFDWRVSSARPDHLSVQLLAPEGPVGTRNYSVRFEAAPVGAERMFVRFAYAYEPGFAARMATSAYLATSGRHKVGFSIVGRDEAGRPLRVGGIQGIAERNTMRYYLAIETFLDSLAAPAPQRLERRLRQFHAALERYPAQLHEMDLPAYLAMKQREIPQDPLLAANAAADADGRGTAR